MKPSTAFRPITIAGLLLTACCTHADPGINLMETAVTCGADWRPAIPLPGEVRLRGVGEGYGHFVAVGDGGRILTSPNGMNWAPRASGTLNGLAGVAWSGEQFAAVGDGGTILTSPDIVTWKARTSGTTANLLAVTWGRDQFVAVGYPGTILTSPDGVTWTTRASETSLLTGVTWGGWGRKQFVAVGYPGVILTSPDGVDWKAHASGTTLHSVTWGGNQFVAVGYDGAILTSPDGTAWTAQASGTPHDLTSVAWNGQQFVAVGNPGTLLTSPDGINWITRASGTPNGLTGVAWNGNQFLAVGEVGTILTSPCGFNSVAYEYFSPSLGHYFLTASWDEVVVLDQEGSGWVRSGRSFRVSSIPMPGLLPVCRFFGTDAYTVNGQRIGPNAFFYTASPEECESLKTGWQALAADGQYYPAWTFESVAFYVSPVTPEGCGWGMMPIYRAYNGGQNGDPNHRFSADKYLLDIVMDWIVEGTAWCVQP